MQVVHYCLSPAVLPTEKVRSFARRARQYMLAYKAVEEQMEDADMDEESKDVKMSHTLMEKCVNMFRKRKTHRNVVDFESAFIRSVLVKMEESP